MGYEILTRSGGKLKPLIGDDIDGALIVMENDHWENHKGMLYGGYYENMSAPGAVFAFSFKTPPIEYGIVHYRSAGIQPTKDNVRTQIYEDAVIDVEGTIVQFDCNNRLKNTPLPSELELRAGTTFSDDGILLSGFSSFLPGVAGNGQERIPQAGGASLDELIMKPDTVYRFININGSDQTNVIASKFRFYLVKRGE